MLYKMLVTASSALRDLGSSGAGRGGGRERWNFLYSSADVESSTDLGGLFEPDCEPDCELEERKRVVVLDAALLSPCERKRLASDIVVAVMASYRETRRQSLDRMAVSWLHTSQIYPLLVVNGGEGGQDSTEGDGKEFMSSNSIFTDSDTKLHTRDTYSSPIITETRLVHRRSERHTETTQVSSKTTHLRDSF